MSFKGKFFHIQHGPNQLKLFDVVIAFSSLKEWARLEVMNTCYCSCEQLELMFVCVCVCVWVSRGGLDHMTGSVYACLSCSVTL